MGPNRSIDVSRPTLREKGLEGAGSGGRRDQEGPRPDSHARKSSGDDSFPSVSRTDWPPPEGLTGDGRALHPRRSSGCGFSFFASKRSLFFHTIRVMAAILRAKVSRAIVDL